jgi:hypothetical protein
VAGNLRRSHAEGSRQVKVGQVLIFDYEGSRNEYKVMRVGKGKCCVRPVTLYLPDEVKIVEKEKGDGGQAQGS